MDDLDSRWGPSFPLLGAGCGQLLGHAQASAARADDGMFIALYDERGNALIDTSAPFGASLPARADHERLSELFAGAQARVSRLHRSRDGKELTVIVDLPIIVGGERYLLSQIYTAAHFQHVLAQHQVPDSWIVGVFDTDHTTIARSHRVAEMVGKPGSDILREAAAEASEGHVRHTSLR